MKGFNFSQAFTFARTVHGATLIGGAWTCRQCLLQLRGSKIGNQARRYAGRSNAYGNGRWKSANPKRRRRVLIAAAGGTLGATAVALTDDVKHAYEAVERTGRVVSTLAVCINESVFNGRRKIVARLMRGQLPSHVESE
jgi:aarF domain-containing kinase